MTRLEYEQWLTVEKVAANLDVSEETVRRWIRNGELPALKFGGNRSGYRILPADLAAFLTERYGTHKSDGAA